MVTTGVQIPASALLWNIDRERPAGVALVDSRFVNAAGI
jgi:hypothetical protein